MKRRNTTQFHFAAAKLSEQAGLSGPVRRKYRLNLDFICICKQADSHTRPHKPAALLQHWIVFECGISPEFTSRKGGRHLQASNDSVSL